MRPIFQLITPKRCPPPLGSFLLTRPNHNQYYSREGDNRGLEKIMSYWTGRFSFPSTGTQTITVGSFQPTEARITVAGNVAADDSSFSIGTTDGTRQNAQYSYGSGSTNSKIINLKDESGVDKMIAAWTSFGFSGGQGTVTFSVTTNDSSLQPTIEVRA